MNPNRQQLLDSIQPCMKLDRAFFLKVYGYEISFPGFADKVIWTLEEAGCSKARKYYDMTVTEYQARNDKELRPIAKQIIKQSEVEWKQLQKEGAERRRRKV